MSPRCPSAQTCKGFQSVTISVNVVQIVDWNFVFVLFSVDRTTAGTVINWPIWAELDEEAPRKHVYDNAGRFFAFNLAPFPLEHWLRAFE